MTRATRRTCQHPFARALIPSSLSSQQVAYSSLSFKMASSAKAVQTFGKKKVHIAHWGSHSYS